MISRRIASVLMVVSCATAGCATLFPRSYGGRGRAQPSDPNESLPARSHAGRAGGSNDGPADDRAPANAGKGNNTLPWTGIGAEMPELKAEGHLDPEKVKKGFIAAKPNNFASTKKPIKIDWAMRRAVPNAPLIDIEGEHTAGVVFEETNVKALDYAPLYELPAGTPILVVEVSPDRFVPGHGHVLGITPEGLQWLFDATHLDAFDSAASWPAPAKRTFLKIEQVPSLATLGLIPKDLAEAIATAEANAGKCAEKTWEPFSKQSEAVEVQDIRASTKAARKEQLYDQAVAAVIRNCGRFSTPVGKAMKKIIEIRRDAQAKLDADLRAHFKK